MSTFAGYRRVSRVGDRKDTLRSPEDQAKLIEAWAKRTRHEVEVLPPELDRSGGDADRPILGAAVERIERGELAGLVVYRLDRGWRSLRDQLSVIERVEAAGGRIESATEDFGNGSSGNLQRNIIGAIAQAERERQAEGFDRAKADAIERGIYIGRAPIGYVTGPDRRLRRDPATWQVVREAFRRRARGDSWRSIADYMAKRLGRGMLPASVRAMIQNTAYLGVARQGKHINPAAHEPIVDRATWEAAQLDHPRPPRGKHGTGLLIGVIRCAGCSKRMTSSVGPKGRVYRCRRHHAGGECPEPATIMGRLIEPYVTEAVLSHLRSGRVTYRQRSDALAEAQAALEAAERSRDELHKSMDIAKVGAEHFAAAIRDVAAEVEQRRRELAEAQVSTDPVPQDATIGEILEDLDVDELRHVLRGAVGVVWVRRGRANVERRVRIVARSFEPAGLSVQGIPSGAPVSIDLPEADLDGEIRPATP